MCAAPAFSSKPSILNRPVKRSAHNPSQQTADIDYAKEQAKLEARRKTRAQLADYRGQVLWGTTDQKKQLQAQHKTEVAHYHGLAAAAAHDTKAEQQFYSAQAAAAEAQYAAAQAKRAAASKAYYQSLQQQNQQLAQYRAAQQQHTKVASQLPPAPDNLLNSFGRHAF